MTVAEMIIAIVRVFVVALVLGAGVPILFSLGMRAMTGDPIRDARGVVVDDTPASRQMQLLGWLVYALLAVIVCVAILWVAKETIYHYSGWDIFGVHTGS